MQADKSTQTNF